MGILRCNRSLMISALLKDHISLYLPYYYFESSNPLRGAYVLLIEIICY